MFLNTFYVQKSKLLLYPLLKLPFGNIRPHTTYIGHIGKIKFNDLKLICAYKRDTGEDYFEYRNNVLLKHPYFVDQFKDFWYDYIVFDISEFFNTHNYFLKGQYSKFPDVVKNIILEYYSNTKLGPIFIDTHLNPENYHEFYADHFKADLQSMVDVHETLSPPDLEKETLQ